MSQTIPSTEPQEITAGDTIKWTKSLSDYPASDSWVLSYALVQDGTQIQITSSASGDDHAVVVAASTSANYTAGTYSWQSYVTKGLERYSVDAGIIEILPNFDDQSSGYDDRSHAKKTLDALESVIEGKASKDQMAYTIGGRSLSKMTPQDLIFWRDHYRAECAKEYKKANKKTNQVKVKF